MPVFDVSFLNPNLRPKGGGKDTYSDIITELTKLENSLEIDGKLAPGDYDNLIRDAQRLYSAPGLTRSERNNISVKISNYQKAKALTNLNDTQDIDRLNRDVEDDFRTSRMLFANDVPTLLQAQTDALQGKLERLTQTIQEREQSGADPTVHYNEFNDTLSRYNELLTAKSDAANFQPGKGKASSSVAYVITNNAGEIVDIEFGRVGSKTGFVETNGVYNGFQVYGKINRKDNGKNVFQLGPTAFSAPDILTPDPSNPLSMRSNPLQAETGLSVLGAGNITKGQAGVFHEVDPQTVLPQSAISRGGWARGEKGALYFRDPQSGRFKKYTNVDAKVLNLTENDILNIPRAFESGLTRDVDKTIDGSGGIYPSGFIGPLPQGGVSAAEVAPQTAPAPALTPTLGAGTPRTPAPVERAPQTGPGIAARTLQGVKGFLSSVFK